MTDAQFEAAILLIVNGSRDGLREIYDAYAKQIYQVIAGIVKDPQDAEDLTADLFLKLWETASQYKPGSGHKRYITVMARNLAIDFMRKKGRLSFELDDDESGTEAADSQNIENEVEGSMEFAQALDALSPKQRQIVDLHIGMQLTLQEVSDTLGIPLGTVSWNFRTAIERLRKLYKEGELYG
jgi:RNA polymerase sigma-70 factor (ECF subfamily)